MERNIIIIITTTITIIIYRMHTKAQNVTTVDEMI